MSYRRARAGGFGQQIELLQLIVTDRRQGLVEIVLGPGFPPIARAASVSLTICLAIIALLRTVRQARRGQKTRGLSRGKPGRRSLGLTSLRMPVCNGCMFSIGTEVPNVTINLTRLCSGTPVATARRSKVVM